MRGLSIWDLRFEIWELKKALPLINARAIDLRFEILNFKFKESAPIDKCGGYRFEIWDLRFEILNFRIEETASTDKSEGWWGAFRAFSRFTDESVDLRFEIWDWRNWRNWRDWRDWRKRPHRSTRRAGDEDSKLFSLSTDESVDLRFEIWDLRLKKLKRLKKATSPIDPGGWRSGFKAFFSLHGWIRGFRIKLLDCQIHRWERDGDRL